MFVKCKQNAHSLATNINIKSKSSHKHRMDLASHKPLSTHLGIALNGVLSAIGGYLRLFEANEELQNSNYEFGLDAIREKQGVMLLVYYHLIGLGF